MKLGTKEIPALRLGAAAVLKAYLGGSQVWPLGFDLAALFAQGEPGVWYDPSDLSTLFQDAAGTTPVTAVEQPVGLMLDKSGNGNHAFQATATSRPVLSARYNLLTKTEQFDDAVWTANGRNVSVVSGQTDPFGGTTASKIVENTANGPHYILQKSGAQFLSGVSYKLSFYGKGNGRYLRFSLEKDRAGGLGMVVDLSSGVLLGNVSNAAPGIYVSSAISASENGFYRVEFVITTSQTGSWDVAFLLSNTNSLVWAPTYTGDGTSGIYIWGADLRVANDGVNLPPYQRVNTATDYDTAGFPYYLRFDGVDDWLVTPTITPGTDKAQVFAGVRKLSDATRGTLVETGDTYWTVNGFSVQASATSTDAGASSPFANYYAAVSVGNGAGVGDFDVFNTQNVYPSPSTNTISAVFDRDAAPLSKTNLRVNGVVPTKVTGSFTGTAVTGNVLNTPLYIGRRAGTSGPFNGHLYSLIVRFGSNLPAATIEKTEKYINTKTRAY